MLRKMIHINEHNEIVVKLKAERDEAVRLGMGQMERRDKFEAERDEWKKKHDDQYSRVTAFAESFKHPDWPAKKALPKDWHGIYDDDIKLFHELQTEQDELKRDVVNAVAAQAWVERAYGELFREAGHAGDPGDETIRGGEVCLVGKKHYENLQREVTEMNGQCDYLKNEISTWAGDFQILSEKSPSVPKVVTEECGGCKGWKLICPPDSTNRSLACPTCNGEGRVPVRCKYCSEGKMIKWNGTSYTCSVCKGYGYQTEKVFKIPTKDEVWWPGNPACPLEFQWCAKRIDGKIVEGWFAGSKNVDAAAIPLTECVADEFTAKLFAGLFEKGGA